MIVPAQHMPIVMATRPVDFRGGHSALASIVQNELRLDPHSGVTVVFRSKRGDRVSLGFERGICGDVPGSFQNIVSIVGTPRRSAPNPTPIHSLASHSHSFVKRGRICPPRRAIADQIKARLYFRNNCKISNK